MHWLESYYHMSEVTFSAIKEKKSSNPYHLWEWIEHGNGYWTSIPGIGPPGHTSHVRRACWTFGEKVHQNNPICKKPIEPNTS